ncbi:MAG: class I mannose-6-phosphate isomerase [Chloroflexi bacterium]|nr:class I mannose-6-phosphate isomerase [Chloroflexota bacterium]
MTLPLRLLPDLRPRVWGGSRLRDALRPELAAEPIGEAWVAWDGCRVANGPEAGRTLAEVVADDPVGVLGPDGAAASDGRFPVLVKILDTAAWLSLQVHPDDAMAARLEGPGAVGKTESWYVLAADPGAELILGLVPGMTDAGALAAIRDGTLHEHARRVGVHPGDVVLVRAGTLHSIGPGILLYELQQSSDLTYRVSDWGRPATEGRRLHLEQSVASLLPRATTVPRATRLEPDDRLTAIACEKFVGDLVAVRSEPAALDTAGRSFHVVTVVEGSVVVACAGGSEAVGLFESVIVPAAAGGYAIRPAGASARAVVARVP